MRRLFAISPLPSLAYTKYNIHTQKKQTNKQGETTYSASFLNFTDPGSNHVIIPVNTPVRIEPWFGMKSFIKKVPYSGIVLFTNEYGQKVYIDYDPRYTNMSYKDYAELITSSEPVSLDSFSELDLKGIKEGKAYKGMTKEGVMKALGYPAAHKTPSLEAKTWIYWKSNRITTNVVFGTDGKVTSVQ